VALDHHRARAPEVDTLEGWYRSDCARAHTSTIRTANLVCCDRSGSRFAPEDGPPPSSDLRWSTRARRVGWGAVTGRAGDHGFGPGNRRRYARQSGAKTLESPSGCRGRAFDRRRALQFAGQSGGPVPAQTHAPIPIAAEEARSSTMPLRAAFADWWNCPRYARDRIDELRPSREGTLASDAATDRPRARTARRVTM